MDRRGITGEEDKQGCYVIVSSTGKCILSSFYIHLVDQPQQHIAYHHATAGYRLYSIVARCHISELKLSPPCHQYLPADSSVVTGFSVTASVTRASLAHRGFVARPLLCSVQWAVCCVQCAVYSVQCSGCSVQCAVRSVQCAVCSVQCAVCSVQCAVCSLQCAV